MTEIEKQIADLTSKVEALSKENDTLKASVDTIKTENDTLKAELKTANEAKASLDAELSKVRAAEKLAKRIAQLVDGGFTKEEAEKKVSQFDSLTDEQYTVVANELVEAAKKKKEADDMMSNKVKCEEDEKKKKEEADAAAAKKKAEEEAISKAKLEDGVIIPQSGEDESVKKTRASLAEMFDKMFTNKTKVKLNK